MPKWNLTLEGGTEPIEITADGYQMSGSALAFFTRPVQMFQQPTLIAAYNNWILLEPVPNEIEV